MELIIAKNSGKTAKEVIDRLQHVGKRIKSGIDPLIPPILRDIHNGQEQFRNQATNVRNIIDSAIGSIHSNTVEVTKTFDDVYDTFGADRSIINVIVCFVLLIVSKKGSLAIYQYSSDNLLQILLFLIIALICGCCGRRRRGYRDDCCSKGTGASCLLL